MHIRTAQATDADALLAIYRPFVEDSAASFEIEPPSVEEFAERINVALSRYAWLVAQENSESSPAGYAYACTHRARAAYRYSVETSVYVSQAHHRQGVGRLLYEALFKRLNQLGFRNAYAGVTLPNDASVAFHERMGFISIGVFQGVGYKFDNWHDVAWFQRPVQAVT